MHPQPWTHRSGGKRRRTLGRKDQNFQRGGQTLPHSWLRLNSSARRSKFLPILVPLLKTPARHVFSHLGNQVAFTNSENNFLERPPFAVFILHSSLAFQQCKIFIVQHHLTTFTFIQTRESISIMKLAETASYDLSNLYLCIFTLLEGTHSIQETKPKFARAKATSLPAAHQMRPPPR